MPTEIRVPTLGELVTEATIGQWFKHPGDTVAADEPLVELETDKVTIEVPAPAAGVLAEVLVKDGETVGVGALLGSISEEGVAARTGAKPAARAEVGKPGAVAKAEPAKAAPAAAAPAARPVVAEAKPAPAAAAPRPGPVPAAMPPAPAARKMLDEKGISTAEVAGSGRRGQVLKEDVLAAMNSETLAARPAEAPRAPIAADDAAREERVKMSRLRQTIARRLKEAQNTAAMLTTFNEVDMSAVMALRSSFKDLFEKKHGVKLGFMGFFVKASVQALKEIPAVNAEIDGQDLVYKNYYHVGVAVGTDKGLVVPVIRDCDALSLAEIEKKIGEAGKRARDGQLKIEEMQGGTFTISNGGVYGSLMSTPILNAPQSGILGMHKIQERVVVINGKMEIRPMMYLALSYDHRVVDGKEAVTFLVRVKEMIEDPQRLVLDL